MLNLAPTRRQLRSLRRYQGGWVQIVYYIVVLILTIVLAPKPPKPRAATLDDFDVPVAEEDRAIPVLFGTWRITGANVVWYGDLSTKKMKKSGLFSSTTVGYKYYLGMHLALCHGPVDAFLKLEAADKLAWEGEVTENEEIEVNQPKLFGGDKREGGLFLHIDVEMGEPDQPVNEYLESKQPAPVPAYRGVFCLVSKTGAIDSTGGGIVGYILGVTRLGYVGTTPYVKAWAITARRILKGWNTDVWYPEKATITMESGTGMNGAHIIYQCLTDPEWGMSGDPDEDIDLATFTAAADTLFDEGFGLNMLWNQQSTIEDFIGTVLDHIAGVLTFDCSTGKYQLILIRGDYEVSELPIFDESNLVDMDSCERRSWGETVNELTLSFTDHETGKATSMIVQDLGNIRSQGGVRIPSKADFTAISDPALMKVVAGRELLAGATPLARIELTATRAFWEQHPGGVIRAKWDAHKLPLTVFRVISTRGGTLQNGMIKAQCVEDIYALGGIEYAVVPQPPTPETPPENPEDPDDTSGSVIDTRTAPPAPETVQDGDRYIIGPGGGTGQWAGQPEGTLVEADVDGDTWIFSTPPPGAIIYDQATGQHVQVDQYGAQQPSPWTPAIPPLDEVAETTPTLSDFDIVLYDTVESKYYKIPATKVGAGLGSVLTADDETAELPNSRQLVDGTNISFDLSVPGELKINASGGGGSDYEEYYLNATVTITSDTTYADMLFVDLGVGTYEIETLLRWTSHATPDFKSRWHFTGTATNFLLNILAGIEASSTAFMNYITAFDVDAVNTTTGGIQAQGRGTIEVTVAGRLSWQAAQNTSSLTSVSVNRGSHLKVRQIS